MSMLSSWILSITVVAIFSVVVDMVLPRGEISKYIKLIVSVVMVLIIVSPISRLDRTKLEDLLISDVSYDPGIIYLINTSKAESLREDIDNMLTEAGYAGAAVELNVDLFSDTFRVITIFVDLSDSVLKTDKANIDKYTEVRGIIMSICDIEEENILLYG